MLSSCSQGCSKLCNLSRTRSDHKDDNNSVSSVSRYDGADESIRWDISKGSPLIRRLLVMGLHLEGVHHVMREKARANLYVLSGTFEWHR